jgi:histidinol-phosphatase (PHP family)
MPWFSFHGGHSGSYCRHAKDELAAVIETAIERGFTHYGLSEHCPRDRAQDLYPEEHDLGPGGLAEAFAAYTARAFELRGRYADRIELVVGFETERLPPDGWAARMRELRASAPFEYVVGSVHDVDGVYVDYAAEQTAQLAERLGGRDALHARYFDAVTDMVETLRPEIVGHIDLVRKFDGPAAGFTSAVQPHIERALEAVAACGAALDVNCGAFRRGLSPVYPLPDLLARAARMGIPVTLGDDSHGVSSVGVGLDASLRAIADAGYREVSYLAREPGASRASWRRAPLDQVRPRS